MPEKVERAEQKSLESYYARVESLFNLFDPSVIGDPTYKTKNVEDGRIRLVINRTFEKGFRVVVGPFSYLIWQKTGVGSITVDEIEIGGEFIAAKRRSFFKMPEDPEKKRLITEDIVSWTERVVNSGLMLPFPYQPAYKSEMPQARA